MTAKDSYPYSDPQLLDEIVRRLRGAQRVQVIGHVNPDGDCIGSMLAMHHMLEQWGVAHAMAAQRISSCGNYDQLPGFELIRNKPEADFGCDLVVYVDTANTDRGIDGWIPPAPIINIDHHAGNTRYGAVNWIEHRYAACGEMIYQLARHAGAKLTPEMADSLLIAITTDTGSFRYNNTGADQHRVAAELIDAGASPQGVARVAYDSQPIESLQITGHVLSNLRLEAGGKLAWSELRINECSVFGGPDKAPENLVSLLRSVRGVKVCLLFHELEGGRVRVNFRSDGSVDVCRIATQWGGGGHECAAGLMVKNSADYEKTRDEIIAGTINGLNARS